MHVGLELWQESFEFLLVRSDNFEYIQAFDIQKCHLAILIDIPNNPLDKPLNKPANPLPPDLPHPPAEHIPQPPMPPHNHPLTEHPPDLPGDPPPPALHDILHEIKDVQPHGSGVIEVLAGQGQDLEEGLEGQQGRVVGEQEQQPGEGQPVGGERRGQQRAGQRRVQVRPGRQRVRRD
jgi:hypothetical protein